MAEHIQIFKGKAAKYNKAVLEVLYTRGPQSSSWYISKEISSLYGGDTRNIQSVICRKNGRLDTLAERNYIRIDFEKIQLTHKGIMALLIAEPGIINKIHPDILLILKESVQTTINKIGNMTHMPLGIKIEGLQDAIQKMGYGNMWSSLKGLKRQTEIVEKLIMEGINLDIINEKTLVQLIAFKLNENGFAPG